MQCYQHQQIISKHFNAKECSDYHTTALISHASKVILKILQARLQQYITINLQMFKLNLEKAEESEIKLPTSTGSQRKHGNSRKTSTSTSLTMLNKAFNCVDHNKLQKILKEMENTRPPYLPPEKSVCRSGRNSQNWTWNNRLVPNRKRSASRLYIVTLLI